MKTIIWITIGIIVTIVIGIAVVAAILDYVETKQARNRQRQNLNEYSSNIRSTSTTTSTMPMIYYANDRHNSKDKEYRFQYRKVGNSWRAYILRTPSFRGRSTSLQLTHRHVENGNYYICWDTPITTIKDMQNISKAWADNIQEYITTGRTF